MKRLPYSTFFWNYKIDVLILKKYNKKNYGIDSRI